MLYSEMNVLSLFDGMSCGQIALERAGIHVSNYYASEVDKYAMKVTNANYPDTWQVGCITDWREWTLPKIDLLMGGSPCQGFSFAGKQLNFDDPRSKLFFEFVNILKHVKPKYFLLENVKMKQEYQDVITGLLGVEPIEINSALVSAQNRKRLYWTNIPGVTQPEDKGALLKDIIETGVVDIDKPYCIDANYFKGGNLKANESTKRVYHPEGKRPTLTTMGGGHREPKILYAASMVGRKINNGKRDDYNTDIKAKQYIEISNDPEKSRCLSTVQKDTLLADKESGRHLPEDLKYRKLTPLECERLQTVDDGYTDHCSNTQRYKMLGNGWTVDVIAHIFKGLNEK